MFNNIYILDGVNTYSIFIQNVQKGMCFCFFILPLHVPC